MIVWYSHYGADYNSSDTSIGNGDTDTHFIHIASYEPSSSDSTEDIIWRHDVILVICSFCAWKGTRANKEPWGTSSHKAVSYATCCAKNCTAKHNFGTRCHLSQHLSIKLFTIASFRIKYHIKHVTNKYWLTKRMKTGVYEGYRKQMAKYDWFRKRWE